MQQNIYLKSMYQQQGNKRDEDDELDKRRPVEEARDANVLNVKYSISW